MFVALLSPVFSHSSVSSVGCFAVSFLGWGLSLPSISSLVLMSPCLVLSGFALPTLVPAFSFGLFFISLVHPRRIACFGLGPFLRLLVPGSSLFLSAWCFLSFLGGFSSGFSSVSSLGGSLLSFWRSVVLPLRLTRLHSVSHLAFVPSVVCGVIPVVFLF